MPRFFLLSPAPTQNILVLAYPPIRIKLNNDPDITNDMGKQYLVTEASRLKSPTLLTIPWILLLIITTGSRRGGSRQEAVLEEEQQLDLAT